LSSLILSFVAYAQEVAVDVDVDLDDTDNSSDVDTILFVFQSLMMKDYQKFMEV